MVYSLSYMICAYLARRQCEADNDCEAIKQYDFGRGCDDRAYADLAIAEARKKEIDRVTTDILRLLQSYDK